MAVTYSLSEYNKKNLSTEDSKKDLSGGLLPERSISAWKETENIFLDSQKQKNKERVEKLNAENAKQREARDRFGAAISGFDYGLERFGSGVLGAVEGTVDALAAPVTYGLGKLTSSNLLEPITGQHQEENPVSKFFTGWSDSLLSGGPTQMWNESIEKRYNPTQAQRFIGDINAAIGGMAPAIASGTLAKNIANTGITAVSKAAQQFGPAITQGVFGLGAGGQAANEAKQSGATTEQALLYGTASGTLETAIEGIAGGIPNLPKGMVGDIAKKISSSPVAPQLADMLGEGGEEALSTIITPYLQRAIYDPNAKTATADEIVQSALMGMVVSGALNAPSNISQYAAERRYNQQKDAILSQAMQAPNGSTARTLAEQYSKRGGPLSDLEAGGLVVALGEVGNLPQNTLRNPAEQLLRFNKFVKDQNVQPGTELSSPSVALDNPSIDAVKTNGYNQGGGVNDGGEEVYYTGGRLGNTQNDSQGQAADGAGYRERTQNVRNESGNYRRESQQIFVEDHRGNKITPEISERITGTKITDDTGRPIAVEHFTPNMEFETFGEGDTGFHFGSHTQAEGRAIQKGGKGRTIRAYLNIQSPIRVSSDIMNWKASATAIRLYADGILSAEEAALIDSLSSKGLSYNSPAATELRRMLKEKGYDGIVYPNGYEGAGDSYIAFYPEQVVIFDDGKGDVKNSTNKNLTYGIQSESGDFGPMSLGAAQTNERSFDHLLNQYGAFPPGENPARVVDIPIKDADGRNVSRAVRTISEAEAIPDDFVSSLEPMIANGDFSYDVATDQSAVNYSNNVISQKGYAGALDQWNAAVKSDGVVSKNDIALGQRLLIEAANAGDYATAQRLVAEISAEATRAGQSVQAMRLLKKMTPEGQLYYLQKAVDNLQKDTGADIKLSEKNVSNILNAKNQAELDSAMDAAMDSIANQVPVKWYDKWNAWRYMAMLGNPRTQIRNVVGNAVYVPVVGAKNVIARGLESIAKKNGYLPEASKAFIGNSKADQALLSFAENDYQNMKEFILSGGKMSQQSDILRRRRIFDSDLLESFRKLTESGLDMGDAFFSKHHYNHALAGYLKANGVTAEQLNSSMSNDVKGILERARTYAIKEAQKATFRDSNSIAEWINKQKRTAAKGFRESTGKKKLQYGTGAALLEGLLPFTKTPMNIVSRGIEYSPVGLMNGIFDTVYSVKNGKMSAADALDELAAGLTGTGILALGAFLRSLDLVKGAEDEDKKKAQFDRLKGEQPYSLKIGNKSYTIDWLAPAALPFFTGVAIYDSVKDGGSYSVSRFFDDLSLITEPMLELSMLKGLNDALSAVRYSSSAPLANVISGLATGYLGQAVPTFSGQIARALDETSRQTYYDPNYSGVGKEISAFGQKQAAKIPFLSMMLQPRVDQWGSEQENTGGNVLGRFLFNTLSPGYADSLVSTAVDNELTQLYEATGDSSIFPSFAGKSVKYNGETVKMNGEQYTRYAKTRGQNSYDILSDMIDTSAWDAADDGERTKLISEAYSYATYLANRELLGSDYAPNNKYPNIYAASQKGIDPYKAILYFNMASTDGNSSISQKEAEAYLDRSGLTNAQKSYLFALTNKAWKSNPYK